MNRMNNCKHCGIETNNPKFCSKSCSAKSTNVSDPKRKLTRICVTDGCNCVVATSRTTLCTIHLAQFKLDKTDFKSKTLADYQNRESVKGKHPSWINAHLRAFNRSWNKDLTKRGCEICGYDKHVELCHIKPVRDFDSNATLGEINHPDNMRVLCPNHHWEFDNGLL